MVNIGNDWDELLAEEFGKEYYHKLRSFLIEEYKTNTVYPAAENIYTALRLTPYAKTKAIILGQDPYHEEGQAHGLAFSVPDGIQWPPSLVNIFKELKEDTGIEATSSSLVPWAENGVLLLNTVLTVRAHEAGSHRGKGWEEFTDAVIKVLACRKQPMVFILWGANAISKKDIIMDAMEKSNTRHLIITAPHPSPLSAYRGFFGGRYFSRTNYFLEDNDIETIDWKL